MKQTKLSLNEIKARQMLCNDIEKIIDKYHQKQIAIIERNDKPIKINGEPYYTFKECQDAYGCDIITRQELDRASAHFNRESQISDNMKIFNICVLILLEFKKLLKGDDEYGESNDN